MTIMNRLFASSILATGMILSAPAFAQNPDDSQQSEASAENAGDIVVTARKRSERLLDVPLSITAATGEQLATRGITDVGSLEKISPGFTTQQSWYSAPVYSIRGIGFFDNSNSSSPTVTTYIDQVPLPYAVMTRGAAFDLERVEILKGPQGTLFGQNSTGGAVNFIAARPTSELAAGIDLEVGRFETVNAQAFVSGPLSPNLRARLAVRSESRGDWQKGFPANDIQFGKTGVDTLGERHFFNGRFLLDWDASDRLSFQLGASGWKDKSDTVAPRFVKFSPTAPRNPFNGATYDKFATLIPLPEGSGNRLAGWDRDTNFDRDDSFYQFSLRGTLDLSDAVSLTSISAYSRYKEDSLTEVNGLAGLAQTMGVVADFTSYYQELRLAGEFSRFKWMLGGNYSRDETDENHSAFLAGGTNAGAGPNRYTGALTRNRQKVDTLAAFGSLDFEVTDTVNLHGSLRYTDQKRDFTGCLSDPGDGTLATALAASFGISAAPGICVTQISPGVNPPIITDSLNEDNVSWRVSANWKLNPDAMVYATVSRGWKAGSFTNLSAIWADQLAPAQQESVLAYEAGFKLSALNRRVQLTGAGFYYDYEGKQITGAVLIPPFGALPRLVNIPKSRVAGAELEATLRPVDGLEITGGVTYVHSRIQENPAVPTDAYGASANFVGEAFPNTPRWQGVVDAQYEFSVGSNVNMYLGGSVTARTRSAATLGNTTSQLNGNTPFVLPGYALVDLRAGIRSADGIWAVQIWGRNVTNEYYRVGHFRRVDAIVDIAGMPATYGLTLSYRFP